MIACLRHTPECNPKCQHKPKCKPKCHLKKYCPKQNIFKHVWTHDNNYLLWHFKFKFEYCLDRDEE